MGDRRTQSGRGSEVFVKIDHFLGVVLEFVILLLSLVSSWDSRGCHLPTHFDLRLHRGDGMMDYGSVRSTYSRTFS
jgi:hypothetical protein